MIYLVHLLHIALLNVCIYCTPASRQRYRQWFDFPAVWHGRRLKQRPRGGINKHQLGGVIRQVRGVEQGAASEPAIQAPFNYLRVGIELR